MGDSLPDSRVPADGAPINVPVLTDCGWCGAPAEMVPWPEDSSLRFRRGPRRARCLHGHWTLWEPSAPS